MTTFLDEQLSQLVQEICQHPQSSLARQRGLNQLIGLIQRSQKVWRESLPDYEDALQQTWVYVCRNLCSSFDPARASVITWMNGYLKWRLQDLHRNQIEMAKVRAPAQIGEDGGVIDPIDRLPARPEPPPILDDVLEWLEREAKQLRRIHVRNHPDINCIVLIRRRLPPAATWEQLATEFGLPAATLSSFYQRECFPRLLSFGKSQGYLEET